MRRGSVVGAEHGLLDNGITSGLRGLGNVSVLPDDLLCLLLGVGFGMSDLVGLRNCRLLSWMLPSGFRTR